MLSIHSPLAGVAKSFNVGPWWHLTPNQFRNFDGCMLNGLSNLIKLKENNPWERSRCSLWYRFLGSSIKALLSWNVYSLEETLGANLTLFSPPLVIHLLAGDVERGMHGRLLRLKDQTHARPFVSACPDRQWASRLSYPSVKSQQCITRDGATLLWIRGRPMLMWPSSPGPWSTPKQMRPHTFPPPRCWMKRPW